MGPTWGVTAGSCFCFVFVYIVLSEGVYMRVICGDLCGTCLHLSSFSILLCQGPVIVLRFGPCMGIKILILRRSAQCNRLRAKFKTTNITAEVSRSDFEFFEFA